MKSKRLHKKLNLCGKLNLERIQKSIEAQQLMSLQIVQFEDPGPLAGQLVVRNGRDSDVNAAGWSGLPVQHAWVADQ